MKLFLIRERNDKIIMQNFCTLEVQKTLYYKGESDGDIDIDGAVQCSAVQFSAVQCIIL